MSVTSRCSIYWNK